MKFNFRKIASVIASAIMLGSTAGVALAANYPSPFVVGGTADVAIVITSGSHAGAISDYDAAISVQSALQGLVTTTSTTTTASASGGDSVNLATSARKIYYGDAISAGRASLSTTELPSVLKDGKVIDLRGTEYKYTQTITVGPTASVFGTSGGDLNDPVLHLDVGTGTAAGDTKGYLYNYTLSFTKNINVSDSTNVQGQKVNILGVDYVIGASSTNTTLYLYGAGESVTLAGAESKTVTIAGKEHPVQFIGATSTTTGKISVDGISKTVTKGSSYAFAGDINVYVKDVTYQSYAGGVQSIDLIIGANTLLLQNGQTVKQGADQTTVKGTYTTITGATGGQISGFAVSIAMPTSTKDHLTAGDTFIDPVFGGLKVNLAGAVPDLNSTARAKIKIDTDNNQFAYVTFTSARAGTKGEQKLTYVYDNDTAATTIQPLLAHTTVGTTSNKGVIHVLEGEKALLNDWIVINQGDAGTILNVDDISIDTGTSGTVTFTDVITGDSQKITLTNSSGQYTKTGVNFYGGNGYTITVPDAGTSVNISWNSAGFSIFPRIKLADGGWIAFLTNTVVNNNTALIFPDGQTTLTTGTDGGRPNVTVRGSEVVNGINWSYTGNGAAGQNSTDVNISGINTVRSGPCYFNVSKGPAILYLEPKKWNDASYGNYICIPLTTTGTTEIKIDDPLFNGTAPSFTTYTSDSYKKATIDQYGAFVTKEDRTNENGVATITIPSSQMYLDVLFTASAATVTAGTTAGGVGGTVSIVKDTEIDSVKDKNLVVVGGSCINTVARKIIDANATAPICGADFTTKTTVDAGKRLVKAVASPYNAAKIAVLVAGYEAAETKLAVADLKAGAKTDAGTQTINPVVTTTA